MTSDQCRQARDLLCWTDVQLARYAGIKPETVRYLETGNGRPTSRTFTAIHTAFEVAGVEFIAKNGGGAGVRLRKG